MLQPDKLREADLATSVILAGLGVTVVVGASRMPMGGTYAGMPINWYTSPGFFPLALGALLVLGALAVFVRAWRDGAPRRLAGRWVTILALLPTSRVVRRMLVIWALLASYVACLALHPFAMLGQVFESISGSPWTGFLAEPEGANYVCSSFLFLGLFMACFHRRRPLPSWKGVAFLLGLCLLVAWGVGYVFTQHLYSPLPW